MQLSTLRDRPIVHRHDEVPVGSVAPIVVPASGDETPQLGTAPAGNPAARSL